MVANTGGEGVCLRRTANIDDKDSSICYEEGTRLTSIGPDETGAGGTFHHIRDSKGNTGWVPARYTVEER